MFRTGADCIETIGGVRSLGTTFRVCRLDRPGSVGKSGTAVRPEVLVRVRVSRVSGWIRAGPGNVRSLEWGSAFIDALWLDSFRLSKYESSQYPVLNDVHPGVERSEDITGVDGELEIESKRTSHPNG